MTVGKVLAVVIVIVGATSVMFGQSSPAPRFDLASVKPVAKVSPGVGTGVVRSLPGGRLSADEALLRYIIQVAYGLKSYQIVGGPDWIDSAHFDIDATAASNTSPQQVLLMLQSLLEDRFKLKVRRESRQLPVYELTTAKSGLKMPLKSEPCVDANAPSPYRGPGEAPPPTCGRIQAGAGVNAETGRSLARMNGQNVSIAEFVRVLSNMVGRTVIDRTGIAQTFDLQFTFARDEALDARIANPAGAPSALPDPSTATVFTALQEQLGLKLESAQGPVDVIVIDHIERPTPNAGRK